MEMIEQFYIDSERDRKLKKKSKPRKLNVSICEGRNETSDK
jgi:hypothetical protein